MNLLSSVFGDESTILPIILVVIGFKDYFYQKNIMKTYLTRLFFLLIFPISLCAQVEQGRISDQPFQDNGLFHKYLSFPVLKNKTVRQTDPGIEAMVAAINEDTLRATMSELENWGSRFLMNDNKREIALSLVSKFLSYGYTEVKLDSFYLIVNWSGYADSSWQYNVVCTVEGKSAPEEVYVIGGHWDSISLPDPFGDAPGVNDNGSAVAATLEIARTFRSFNYQPEATIRFVLFAAEELGLFGSTVDAQKSRATDTDIRYMLNMDMISNNPENLPKVKIYHYLDKEWAGQLASEITSLYTDLEVVVPDINIASSSDSYPYWYFDFPVAYFEEFAFSPNWHKPSDTLGNCNIPYLRKITGAALAILAEQQRCPYPLHLTAQSTTQNIRLSWKTTANGRVKGYNIYRSASSEGPFFKINQALVADSIYADPVSKPHQSWYYRITSVNDSAQESLPSPEVKGARFAFSDSLLVVANLKGSKTTPDSIRNFYEVLLDTIPHQWTEINADHSISLEEFSRFRNILWMANSTEFEPLSVEITEGARAFAANGGNLFYAGFSPARYWLDKNLPVPFKVPENTLLRDLFHVDSVDRKAQSMMCGSYGISPGYPDLRVDPHKFMDKKYPGEIYMVDVFSADPIASLIYRFDSKHDSMNVLGKMKHRPTGLEFMGSGSKSILLGFPLYYLDTADAKQLISYVMREKFVHPVGIKDPGSKKIHPVKLFPNPASEFCNLSVNLKQKTPVDVTLIRHAGQSVIHHRFEHLNAGQNIITLNISGLSEGYYIVIIRFSDEIYVERLLKASVKIDFQEEW